MMPQQSFMSVQRMSGYGLNCNMVTEVVSLCVQPCYIAFCCVFCFEINKYCIALRTFSRLAHSELYADSYPIAIRVLLSNAD